MVAVILTSQDRILYATMCLSSFITRRASASVCAVGNIVPRVQQLAQLGLAMRTAQQIGVLRRTNSTGVMLTLRDNNAACDNPSQVQLNHSTAYMILFMRRESGVAPNSNHCSRNIEGKEHLLVSFSHNLASSRYTIEQMDAVWLLAFHTRSICLVMFSKRWHSFHESCRP